MNKRIKDLSGMKFGKLSVIGIGKQNRKTYWICECECGNIKEVRSDSLKNGSVKSCGCLKKEFDKKNLNRATHNLSKTRIHSIWQGIKGRCLNVNNPSYPNYGGRGITICHEWENSFISFYEWSMKNGYSDDLTIDRIDNDKGYSPDNCRFASDKTQCNNRRSNILIKIGNTNKTLIEWCGIFNLNYKAVHARYKRNKDISIDELFKAIS